MTLASGVSAHSLPYGDYAGVQVRREGNLVYVRGCVSATNSGSTLYIISSNFPSFCCPKNSNYYYFATCSGKRIARCFITTTGRLAIEYLINVSDGSNYTSSSWVEINTSFSVNDIE